MSNHFQFKSFSIIILWVALAGFNLLAQAQLSRNEPTLKIDFSVYPIGGTSWEGVYYQAKPGQYEELTFWSFERSPKHPYEGNGHVEFYRQETNAEGEIQYRKIAEVKPDSVSDEYLFFFIATPGGDSEFQIIDLDEGKHSFPLDTITFINATGANLEGVFGNKPIFIKRGVSAPFDLKSYMQKETLIGLAVQYEGQLQKVLHSKWSFYPNYREIILLLPPKSSGSMRIQAFRITQHAEEMSPPPAAAE